MNIHTVNERMNILHNKTPQMPMICVPNKNNQSIKCFTKFDHAKLNKFLYVNFFFILLSFLKYWYWSSLWILFFFNLFIIFVIKMFFSAIYFLTSWLWIFRWRNFLFNNITEYIRIHIFIFILNCNLIILFINLILNLYLLLILYIIVNLILFKLLILIKRMFLFDLIIVIYI